MAGSDILVVDDDADIREALREALALEGYRVAVAANGREAWEWLQSSAAPSLVLLDLMMPVMDGGELLGLVRGDDRLRGIPVILVTAFGSLAAAFASRSQACLAKPLDLEDLMALVARYCGPGRS
jgi:CheY-like chemotaxis protein